MEQLANAIIENGITYVLGKDELYYPELELQSVLKEDIGKYGLLKLQYMQQHQRYEYIKLMLSGKIHAYLYQLNEECYGYLQKLVVQMKEAAGITENMKRTEPMKWVHLINNIRSAAEEIILREMVYNGKL